MGDQIAKGEEFLNKAEKKINGWDLFSSKYEDAAELYEKYANSFKIAKAWDRAAAVYIKLADCHLKLDSRHDAASAYVAAANAHKNISPKEAILFNFQQLCLDMAVCQFMEIGRFDMAARFCKEIGELCESQQNVDQAISYFERAADLFHSEDVNTSANQCKLKVAEFAAQQKQYPKAIEIYEEIARQSLNEKLLTYIVTGYLFNAALFQLCKDDIVALTNALEKYQDLHPTFSGTRECKLLTDVAAALDEEDVGKFSYDVNEFGKTQLDAWKIIMLLREEEGLKEKELRGPDLT
ncbi:hypothetical protein MKX03_022596 [Papaver bracteatum]|nr:hypothetical protein MKX03_022596 [Papaver bracteatum]